MIGLLSLGLLFVLIPADTAGRGECRSPLCCITCMLHLPSVLMKMNTILIKSVLDLNFSSKRSSGKRIVQLYQAEVDSSC